VVEVSDAGSLPFVGDYQRFLDGALNYRRAVNSSTSFFERKIVDGFIDKIRAGVGIPNYPQYRDMNQMFLDVIDGITKVDGGYIETDSLTVKNEKGILPEVLTLKTCSLEIGQRLGNSFQLRICVTGPYTLSSIFAYKDKNTFSRLGAVLTKIVEDNIFSNKYGSVRLVAVDEPVFGFIDDPLLDRGSESRENLVKAWESMMQKARSKGAQTCLHLHSTVNELFWEVKSLDAIELPANDQLYQTVRTKEWLESTDKFLNVSIGLTDFDQLIRGNIIASSKQKLSEAVINEEIAEAWKSLNEGKIDPTVFLEDEEVMRERLNKTIERFGANRVLYAGPECGLRGFPTYESALECLRRVARAAKSIAK